MRKLNNSWLNFLQNALRKLTEGEPIKYIDIRPSKIPQMPGVYLISVGEGSTEEPYYVGRSKNLRNRIYRNHLMGQLSNARLKKYLIESREVKNIKEAKKFIKEFCNVRWFIETDTRKRGAIEGYVTGIIFPKYGIYEEH